MNPEIPISKAKYKKQKKQEQTENLIQAEVMRYLSQNEKMLMTQTESEKEIEEMKKETNKYLESLKSKSAEELFDEIIKAINETMEEEKRGKEIEERIILANEQIKSHYSNSKAVDKNYAELDAYNKTILKKIKQITEDKKHLAELEEEKTKDIIEQCEKFKKESLEKYNSCSVKTIKKNNAELEKKMNESIYSTQKIKENIEAQHDLRDNKKLDLESLFTSHIKERLDSLTKQSNEFKEENEKLQAEFEKEEEKRKELNNTLKKKTKRFELQKKELDKVMRDLISIQQENNELKKIDAICLRKENEKNKEKLAELVKKNKELQAKIKELKELKEKRASEGTVPQIKEEEQPEKK